MNEEESFEDKMQKFYQEHPLYTNFEIDVPDDLTKLQLEIILVECIGCKIERPFKVFDDFFTRKNNYEDRKILWSIKDLTPNKNIPHNRGISELTQFHFGIEYSCQHCGIIYFYILRVDIVNNKLYKIGQYPPPTEKINSTIQKELGFLQTDLFRKGLRNLNQGYGIGACAYMRRLIEDRINSILNILKDESNDLERTKIIEEAIQAKDFTKKTSIAKDFAPDSLRIGDLNVLKIIHDEYSKSLHGLSDEESLKTAIKLREALEFVLSELTSREKKRKAFIEKMKDVQKGRSDYSK